MKKLKNKFLIFIIGIACFITGIIAGFIFKIYDKINIEDLIYKEDKTIQSASLPKPTAYPVGNLTVEQLFNIDTTKVQRKKLVKKIETYADLTHPESDIKDITFKIDGYVEELYADFTGEYVKKGQPLVKIYSPQLVSAQEEFLRAYEYYQKMKNTDDEVLKKTAKDFYEASYKRLLYWDITEKQIENLKKTKKVFKTMTLYSPYDGWIMEKFVYLGSKVKAGKPLFRIAKHKDLWLMVKVYEKDIPFVKEGQNVDIKFDAYPDKIYKGKIDYVYPMMDFKNRTKDVRIVIQNKDYKLVPGMYSKVTIKIPIGEALVLPETAVINTGKRQIVFYQKEKGIFKPLYVKLGRYVDGYYEILSGVKEGMVVANSALFLLDADAQLKGEYRKLNEKASIGKKK
ncbi:efflux RND transporter periplasmic adaptor subunit [Hydrogenothermus marinus]|uniref:Cu(I)/Ag(I) efflux system membrane fusion protein n=1 Tax=Hydrogenothermus marinus TaxID=133270 RepID=A0A3M0BTA0_9AQUI|nr:efflux RND transporter periplasmic adaptor subunit [Hydrogenothermus marinus]RMA97755.1 Cu(I)/Ag(I) efflux system membrane fusion protein [Hydrogenothermus marinus]